MTDTGAISPGTMADDNTVGTVAWANPDNAKVFDGVYSIAGIGEATTTHYLKATNFGFTIPVGSTIDGIIAEVDRKALGSGADIKDFSVKIVKAGSITGDDKAKTDWWGGEAYISYGGTTDLWGVSWEYDDINSSDFGIVFSCKDYTFTTPSFAYVDHIRITVYYTEGGPTGYFLFR